MTSISSSKIYTSGKTLSNVSISFNNNHITSIQPFEGFPTYKNICAPFFDTHINGGEKLYLTQDNSEAAIDDIFKASYQTGTFYVLPCIITSSPENILKSFEVMRSYQKKNPTSGVIGMHLEGPFLNPLRRGAHLAKYIRVPTDLEIKSILEKGKDLIKIWTIAPEQFSQSQIEMIQDAGVCISVGHSNATVNEAKSAFSKGINLVTHLYNAMSGLHHRKPGLVGAALANKEVWAPVIIDGKHCDFEAVKLAFNAKPERLFLISDALFLGRQKIEFQWEEFDAKLINGEYVNSDGNLAGSAISIGEAINNAVNEVGIPLETAIEMSTERPFNALGLDPKFGQIKEGSPAIFTSFDEELSTFEVLDLRN
ncbi:MAG: N-acetylglucosamine-6-phosphate deacetylase [Algoriphagus sp.]|jgi:N-acetylglucosamine-6-phosphate deacetylase